MANQDLEIMYKRMTKRITDFGFEGFNSFNITKAYESKRDESVPTPNIRELKDANLRAFAILKKTDGTKVYAAIFRIVGGVFVEIEFYNDGTDSYLNEEQTDDLKSVVTNIRDTILRHIKYYKPRCIGERIIDIRDAAEDEGKKYENYEKRFIRDGEVKSTYGFNLNYINGHTKANMDWISETTRNGDRVKILSLQESY